MKKTTCAIAILLCLLAVSAASCTSGSVDPYETAGSTSASDSTEQTTWETDMTGETRPADPADSGIPTDTNVDSETFPDFLESMEGMEFETTEDGAIILPPIFFDP